jgi:prepilin-type N-terminal cleavage/methylation domain-containing protein
MKNKQTGVTLLELVLVLAVIALVILMAARYYQSAQEEMKVTKTVEAIHKITEASFDWVQGAHDFADTGGKTLRQALIDAKEIAANDFVNPWNPTKDNDITVESFSAFPPVPGPTPPPPNSAIEICIKNISDIGYSRITTQLAGQNFGAAGGNCVYYPKE